MTNRAEIALQITLKQLDNFKHNFQDFGGDTLEAQAKNNADIAIRIFNEIYNGLVDAIAD